MRARGVVVDYYSAIIIIINHTLTMNFLTMELCNDNKDDRSTHQDVLSRFFHYMG